MSVCLFVGIFCSLAYLNYHMFKLHESFFRCYLWPWLCPPDHNAMRYVLPVFMHDVTFSHNGPNTDVELESATKRIIRRDSSGSVAKLRTRGRSVLSSIGNLVGGETA